MEFEKKNKNYFAEKIIIMFEGALLKTLKTRPGDLVMPDPFG